MRIKIALAAAAAGVVLAACGGAPRSSVAPLVAPQQVSCSQQVTEWSNGPGYPALKHLNDLAWNPIGINAARLHSAVRAVQANPLPVCARGNGQRDWNRLIAQMKRAELNARTGNEGTAAGSLGSAAAIMMSVSMDVDATGYMGRFPG